MVEHRQCTTVSRQYVWGVQYVDELVQVKADRHYYVFQDANFNVLGLMNKFGQLAERYEYTPYGQRMVFKHTILNGDATGSTPGVPDGTCDFADWQYYDDRHDIPATSYPTLDFNEDGQINFADYQIILDNWYCSQIDYSNDPLVCLPRNNGYNLCDIGHQGLLHDTETGLVYNRARMYSPTLARFMQRDPIGYEDEKNLYQYERHQPQVNLDPDGEITWNLDKAACQIEMTVRVQINWLGDWTWQRKRQFREKSKNSIETTFGSSAFKIYPGKKWDISNSGNGIKCRRCPCQGGWSPKVEVKFSFLFHAADLTWNVTANPPPAVFIQSSAILGGPTGDFDEADVDGSNKGASVPQIPIVHEFGHLLGIPHPGQWLASPPAVNSPADYAADREALMGGGMSMRARYFEKWLAELNLQRGECGPYTTR